MAMKQRTSGRVGVPRVAADTFRMCFDWIIYDHVTHEYIVDHNKTSFWLLLITL